MARSFDATLKSLWALFKKKGNAKIDARLATLRSTKAGKHGSIKSGTEMPQHLLDCPDTAKFTLLGTAIPPFCLTHATGCIIQSDYRSSNPKSRPCGLLQMV
jgi:hypothetical protein